jgi:hypothetical protein
MLTWSLSAATWTWLGLRRALLSSLESLVLLWWPSGADQVRQVSCIALDLMPRGRWPSASWTDVQAGGIYTHTP